MGKTEKPDKWDQESRDFIEALTGGHARVLNVRRPAASELEKELQRKADYASRTGGGRPRAGHPVTDPLTPYNFKIRASRLERLRELSRSQTRTMQDLLAEAVDDLLEKHAKAA